jgi:exopolyphosphatase / guanosine-5'-triphosphate,3'-diphosphate pyrophosphatase
VRVGVVDIGTNTVRLLVADVEGATMTDVHRQAVVVGLGAGVDATGRLDPRAVARAVDALEAFGETLDRLGAHHRRAVATSASRDAADAGDVMALIARTIGVEPHIVSGEQEARLSFRGATWGLPGPTPVLVIDPGGGSTEFVLGSDHPERAVSVDIGSVRLTERVLPARPASPEQVTAARRHVRALFEAVPLAEAARVIGVGGTFTSLGAILLGLVRHDRDMVHGTGLALDDLDGLVDRLAALTVEQTAAIPALEPGRAPVLLAGAIVAAEALRHSGHDDVVVSETDLLDAMALEVADGA